MNSGLISVVIPVYKVEKYLRCCLDSIINQTYQKLEIILVDDGSPDLSGQICDEYVQKDQRIKVIHCENGGAGKARNIGSKEIKGEYVAYVDSDDFMASNMYELMMNYMSEDVDIVECEHVNVLSEQSEFSFQKDVSILDNEYTTKDALQEHLKDHYFRQLIWNKLYRRHVVEHILFPEGKKIDDEYWMYQVLGNAKKLVHIDAKLYAYRQQENSVMHSMDAEKRLQAVEAKELRHQYIIKYWPQLTQESAKSLWLTCIYQGQIALRSMNRQQIEKTFQYLNKITKKYPVDFTNIQEQGKWFRMAQVSLKNTCKLRNALHVGL